MELAGQIIGIAATVIAIVMLQTNNRRRLLFLQSLCNFMFVIHYAMLGAMTGAAMNIVAGTRTAVFNFSDKKWASSVWWVVGFLVLTVGLGIFSWEGPVSLLFIGSSVLKTVGLRWGSTKTLRRIYFPCAVATFIYDAFSLSIGGMLTEGFAAVSSLVAMIRFDRKKKEN